MLQVVLFAVILGLALIAIAPEKSKPLLELLGSLQDVVLNSVGIPTSGIALIIGVDRILDMSRTAINVTGDLTACLVRERWIGGKKTASEELHEEKVREKTRLRTGEDVITG